jgi:hypothetical protein
MKAEAKAKTETKKRCHTHVSRLTITQSCFGSAHHKQLSQLTIHNSQFTTHSMNKPISWNRIYFLILLYNAILVLIFFLVRHYFNIN